MARLYDASYGAYPPWSSLIAQTEANYEVARNYYSQKKQAFMSKMTVNGQEIWRELLNELDKKSQTFLEKVKIRANHVISQGTYPEVEQAKDNEFSVEINDIFQHAHKKRSGNGLTLNAKHLGQKYEDFLGNHAFDSEDYAKVKQFIKDNVSYLTQQVGKVKQESWAINTSDETRTDFALHTSGSKVGQMELKYEIDLEEELPPGLSFEQMILNELQRSNIDVNLYGFQIKTYEHGADAKRWSNGSAFAQRINDAFQSASQKSWSSEYVINYPVWYLSKYIINIINPVNIGNITLGGIEFMDEFLSKYRLYMEASWERSTGRGASKARGGGQEVLNPSIKTGKVLTSSVNKMHGTYQFRGFRYAGNFRNSKYSEKVNGNEVYFKVASFRKI